MTGFGAIVAALTLCSLALTALAWRRDRPLVWHFQPPEPIPENGPARFETLLDFQAQSGQAHSPSILLDDKGFSLLWFQGSKEAQADVDIHGLRFARDQGGWAAQGTPAPVLTRAGLGQAFEPAQLVVTLGNVVQNDAAQDSLFVTLASLGGWAAASTASVHLSGNDAGATQKLNLSPLLDRSNLVKSPMVAYADGSFGLPAYYEVKTVFSELVRFGPDGRVRDKRRMSHGEQIIQPMIVPLDQNRAIAFMRNYTKAMAGMRILRTKDGGQTWAPMPDCGLPNPGAPVAALNLGGGRILIAFNDDEDRADLMRLALSDDEGQSWRRIHTLEDGGGDPERVCRYPMMRVLPGGDILLAYSVNRKRGLRAHLFNVAWVNAQ